MSFTFNWPRFSDQFHYDAIQMLNTALNKGNKPPVIADRIEVVELEMGTQPPELEIRDVGDLTMDQFRGIFRLTYSGDAHIVLKTKVQANPLNHKQPDTTLITGARGMLAAKQPLVVPMLLRLSHFKLNSYVVLVVSKQKGITLVFKTDPLENVDINSTFDSIGVIQKFIQKEIEGQLRQMFREDLPGIIHRLSQQWVKAKVEAPYLSKRFSGSTPPSPPPAPPPTARQQKYDPMSGPPGLQALGLRSQMQRHQSYPRPPASVASTRRTTTSLDTRITAAPPSPPDSTSSSHPDLENYDPTYGLRPEGIPTKPAFSGFGNLFAKRSKGLADLTEETEVAESSNGDYDEFDYEEVASFDVVDWQTPPTVLSNNSSDGKDRRGTSPEYEVIPAIGGGTITRPRIYHSQSIAASEASGSRPRPGMMSRTNSLGHGNSYFASFRPDSAVPFRTHTNSPSLHPGFSQRPTSDEGSTPPRSRPTSLHLPITPPLSDRPGSEDRDSSGPMYMKRPVSPTPSKDPFTSNHSPPHSRRPSISSSTGDIFPRRSNLPIPSSESDTGVAASPPKQIILRPSLHNSIHHLSTLSHSNHTLSPYTRSLEHFTVRSVPPRAGEGATHAGVAGVGGDRVKAKRKRTYHIGSKKPTPTAPLPRKKSFPSPIPPSEFDAEDMDRYFRVDHNIGNPEYQVHGGLGRRTPRMR